MKKIFAIFLSLVMIMSLGVPAFAADTTITGTEEGSNSASKDVTASYTPAGTEDTESTYSVVGISNWDPNDESMVMTWNEDNNRYELVLTNVTARDYEYQVIKNKSWDDGYWSDQGYVAGNATFTVGCDGSTVTITFDGTKTDEIVTSPVDDTPATITGVSITVDETTYGYGQTATITPTTQSIVITVTGTNLQNGTENNVVIYAPGCSITVSERYEWDISGDGSVATNDSSNSLSAFKDAISAFEIQYSNDFLTNQNLTGSGVYVVYDSGIAEEDKAVIDGVSITVDDTTYENGQTATITPDSTVSITVTGTNLQNGTVNNRVAYADGYDANLSYRGFEIYGGGTTATLSIDANKFANTTTVFQIKYSNDGGSNWTGSGVYVIYGSGSIEITTANITGVSITVDDTTYENGQTATITPNSTVSITVTGTNLNNGTEANLVKYAAGYDLNLSYSGFEINGGGTTATLNIDTKPFVNTTTAVQIMYSNDGAQSWNGSGVYVVYDSGSTEADKAVITGVSITVDGVKYTSGTVTITPNSTVSITVTGTNLNNGTEDNVVYFASFLTTELTKFTVDPAGTTATYHLLNNDCFVGSSNFEIQYTNNGAQSCTNTGIFVTYDDSIIEEDKAVIDGVSITVDGNTYTSGIATITPNTTSITLTVTGTNLKNGTMDNMVAYAPGSSIDVSTDQSWNFEDDGSGATIDISQSLIDFISATTAFELEYCNDFLTDETWTGSGVYVIYQSETVSVDITWGSMSFTYDDTVAEGATEETGWTCADGANKITVSNNGTVTVVAKVEYTAADDYTEITGEFDDASATLTKSESKVFTLTLSGKPNQALDGATIGSVTVTIEKAAAAQTISFSIDGTTYQATEGMTWAEWLATNPDTEPYNYTVMTEYEDIVGYEMNSSILFRAVAYLNEGSWYAVKGSDVITADNDYCVVGNTSVANYPSGS